MYDPKPELAGFRQSLADAVEKLIAILDAMDGDADLEDEPRELADDSLESDEHIAGSRP
jgi:hypothetical protein